MQHTCDQCNLLFDIRRHHSVIQGTQRQIVCGTGLNMAYVGHMNREYALCPKCGKLEHQFSAEGRDQEEDAGSNGQTE